MKENCGDLNELQMIGKNKNNPYTIEQILNLNLKCKDGESMKEVQERMQKSISKILENNNGKKVAIVSHGAAIKFFLMKWCKIKNNKIYYKNNEIIVNSPGVVKVMFLKDELYNIETIY